LNLTYDIYLGLTWRMV